MLRAARTAIREDRLTELLAVALRCHEGFARRLLDVAGVPAPGTIEVSTQVRTRLGKRVDMQLLALDATGRHVVGRLWSEHKTGAGFGPGQLRGYATELAQFDGKTVLITIVGHLREVPADSPAQRFTWQDIATLAWQVGREDNDDVSWRAAACEPDAPARQRLLHEFLSYLEEEHHTVLKPISHLDVVAFAYANGAAATINAVLERAADLSPLDPDGSCGWDGNDLGKYWQYFKLPEAGRNHLTGIPSCTWRRTTNGPTTASANRPSGSDSHCRSSTTMSCAPARTASGPTRSSRTGFRSGRWAT